MGIMLVKCLIYVLIQPFNCQKFQEEIKINFQIIKQIKDLNSQTESYCVQFSRLESQLKPKLNMKISSPFLEYIPDCKKKMRRLRKKIYKYLTSKHQTNHFRKIKDLHVTLNSINLPVCLQETLSKKKNIDMCTVRNINICTKVSIEQMINLVNQQQANIKYQYCNWKIQEKQRQKTKLQSLYIKEMMSKRTISSTEQSYIQMDCYKDQSQSDKVCESFYNQINMSTDRNNQFNTFIAQSGFLSMQSSVLSYQNLFK